MKKQLIAIVLGLVSTSALAQCPRNCPRPQPRPAPEYHAPVREERPAPVERPEQRPEARPEERPEQRPEERPEERPEARPDIHATREIEPVERPEVRPDLRPEIRNNASFTAHVGELHYGVRTEDTFRASGPHGVIVVARPFPVGVRITFQPAIYNFAWTGIANNLVLLADLSFATMAQGMGESCTYWAPYEDHTEIYNTCAGAAINFVVIHADGVMDNPWYTLIQGAIRPDGTDGGNLILGPDVVGVYGCQVPFVANVFPDNTYQCILHP